MSIKALLWATESAPVKDVEEFALLAIMAKAADDDGCNAYRTQPYYAKRARIDDRTVRRRLSELESRGVIARGDQSKVAHLPPDKRPIVWDLQIPYSWFSDIDEINDYRDGKGRPPMTRALRPDLKPAPERKRRADAGKPKPRKDGDEPEDAPTEEAAHAAGMPVGADPPAGLQDRPANTVKPDEEAGGLQDRPDSETEAAGLVVHSDRTTRPTTQSLTQSLTQSSAHPTSSGAGSENSSVQPTLDGAVPDPRPDEPDERAQALGIARGWIEFRAKENRPIVMAGRHPDAALHALAKLVEPWLHHGYTVNEIKHALNHLDIGVPSGQQLERGLNQVRRPSTRATGGFGQPTQRRGDVNASWAHVRPPAGASANAGGTGW